MTDFQQFGEETMKVDEFKKALAQARYHIGSLHDEFIAAGLAIEGGKKRRLSSERQTLLRELTGVTRAYNSHLPAFMAFIDQVQSMYGPLPEEVEE